MKRYVVFVALAANHNDWDIACLLKLERPFLFKVKNKLEASYGVVLSVDRRRINILSIQKSSEQSGSSRQGPGRLQADERNFQPTLDDIIYCQTCVAQRHQVKFIWNGQRKIYLRQDTRGPWDPGPRFESSQLLSLVNQPDTLQHSVLI